MKNSRLMIVTAFLFTVISGCRENEVLPTPFADCSYSSRYLTEAEAVQGLNRVSNILRDATIGGKAVEVLPESKIFVSSRVVRKDKVFSQTYGYIVVFSCDSAALHVEESNYEWSTRTGAESAIADVIKNAESKYAANGIKTVERITLSNATCDANNENCSDYYGYRVSYLELMAGNVKQQRLEDELRVLGWYDTVTGGTGIESSLPNRLRNLSARLPADSEVRAASMDLVRLYGRIARK